MTSEEAKLAEEIARLEAELEKTRLESKLSHLKHELSAVGDAVVIQDMVNENGDEIYEEFTEGSYEEYEEEYTEGSYEEEVIEEYEEEIAEEDQCNQQVQPVPAARVNKTPEPATHLIKSPVSAFKRRNTNLASEPEHEVVAPEQVSSASSSQNKSSVVQKVKRKVRPPPSQGGKPLPRNDPAPVAPKQKKNPLSRLLKRNDKANQSPAFIARKGASPSAPEAPKKPVVKRNFNIPPKKAISNGAAPVAAPFKRRVIPNLQPSPAGEETVFEQLLGPKLITNPKLHKCSTRGCVKGQELIGLYFGAMWKSDCKRFVPILKDFYFNAAASNNLEIVYMTADRSLIEFKDCFTTMPFLAMPAGTTELKNNLTKLLKIIEMPALVILDDDGNVVTVEGVKKIQELEKGNAKEANALVDRWKKTRPIPLEEVKQDMALLHGTMERGTVYWN